MIRTGTFGRVVVGAGMLSLLATAAHAADKSLEDRVRVLEQKLSKPAAADSESKALGDRIGAVEKEVVAAKDAAAKQLGVEVHGFVDLNYNYNFNTPGTHVNGIHVFDEDANTFALDQANINIQRNVPDGLGFYTDLDFGKTAEVVGRFTRWSGGTGAGESANSVELRQAYLKYAFGDSGFSLTGGKFVTYHGAEIIKSYNNQNYNISSGILFGNAIPFTHTGLMGTYAFGDMGNVSLGLVNGWDNVADNNDGKSIHGMLTLTPDPMFSFALSTTYGAEQNNSGRSKRLMITPLITIKPTDALTFIIDYNYGNESNIALINSAVLTNDPSTGAYIPGNATWQGVAGYVVYSATDDLQLAFRGEVFDGPDGVRTLFQEGGHGPGATFWEFTPTVAYKLTDGLTARAEYRHDESDKHFFSKNDHFIRGQDTVATELIYAF